MRRTKKLHHIPKAILLYLSRRHETRLRQAAKNCNFYNSPRRWLSEQICQFWKLYFRSKRFLIKNYPAESVLCEKPSTVVVKPLRHLPLIPLKNFEFNNGRIATKKNNNEVQEATKFWGNVRDTKLGNSFSPSSGQCYKAFLEGNLEKDFLLSWNKIINIFRVYFCMKNCIALHFCTQCLEIYGQV